MNHCKMIIVLDTWVLRRAAEGHRDAIEVLHKIYQNCHKICYDDQNKIIKEHRSVQNQFVSQWLKLIYSRKKIKVKIRKTCGNILGHKKDMKFVYACLNYPNKSERYIISEDHHFVINRDKLLKKGICLLSLQEALQIL